MTRTVRVAASMDDKPPVDEKGKKITLDSKSLDETDFIWNANWQSELERMARKEQRDIDEANKVESGFLNFNRTSALDSMDVGLEDKRLKKTESDLEKSVDEMVKGIRDSDAFTNTSKYSLDGYNYVPTRAEKKRWASEWAKAQRFSQGGTTKELTEKVKVEVDLELKEARRLSAEEDYRNLKNRLFLFTAAVGAGLTTTAYVWKGLDTGASFGAGVCFSLLYLRLLSKSVEGMTGGGGGPSAPSILVPVLLFGIFRRWNDLYAEEFGITAQIVPLLMGFFTYKVSTIIETFVTIMKEADDEGPPRASSDGEASGSSGGGGFTLNVPPIEKKSESS